MSADYNKPNRMKPAILTAILTMITPIAWAQDAEPATGGFATDPFSHPLLPIFIILSLIAITIVLIIVVAFYLLKVLNVLVMEAERERALKTGVAPEKTVSWIESIWDNFNASVPVSKEKDIELAHAYDGIKELDNHLPPWWTGLFYGSVIWAVGYMVVYHVTSSLPLSAGEYENELATAAEEARILRASRPAETIDPATLTFTMDEVIIAKGKIAFGSNNCASCHRNDGGGNAIGPNLTDPYWLHGGDIKSVFTTINNGAVDKGMPAWGKVMRQGDIRDLTFYVLSLQGTNPDNAKAPQGQLVQPEEPQTPPDTTRAKTSMK